MNESMFAYSYAFMRELLQTSVYEWMCACVFMSESLQVCVCFVCDWTFPCVCVNT